jgi:hypothetical protein
MLCFSAMNGSTKGRNYQVGTQYNVTIHDIPDVTTVWRLMLCGYSCNDHQRSLTPTTTAWYTVRVIKIKSWNYVVVGRL